MYDVIIIGAGPAGLSAAIYSRRFLMKTLVIGNLVGGLLTTTHLVENWPGEKSIQGAELMMKIEDHAKNLGAEIVSTTVTDIIKSKDNFIVKTLKGDYNAKSIIYAAGTIRRRLGVKGEDKYANKGVSYCATCDAPFFKDKIVGVVGGGDSAAKESLLLTEHAKKVYLIHRGDKIHPEPVNLKRVQEKVKQGKIKLLPNTEVAEIKGDGHKFTSVLLEDGKELKLDGLFVEVGAVPQTNLAKDVGIKLNKKGEIIIDENAKTNLSGFFAAGDCVNRPFKQAITGSAQGVIASFSAYDYVTGNR